VPDPAQPFIEFKNVGKSYGATTVLTNFNLAVMRGEKISLIGPSGSGKTTVLRILMTLEHINSGSVFIDGRPLWSDMAADQRPSREKRLREMRKQIGMVFQQFNLFPHLTVLENVAQPQRIVLGREDKEAKRCARELLATVGLEGKASDYPAQLSGGQKQRVAIARALAMQPKIMLFDEITSALDPELVEEVLNVLRQIGYSTDMTMLLVTHAMSFAHEFSDRVMFLDGGRIVEEAPPDEFFSEPKEERTRAFLRKILASGQRLSK
jgi:polar amino acid transport system ATP-binding protein